jgi:cephalosporin hydroxylase
MLKERITRVLESTNKKSYLKWYLKSELVNRIHWQGVQILKFVPDLWNYQEIISDYKITNVIEFGSFLGGSTIFFADILKIYQTGGKTLSVDIVDEWDPKTNRTDIQKLKASSISDTCRITVKKFREENPGNILDSEHTEEHIYKELQLITPLLKKGDYLIVEDAGDDPRIIVAMKKFFGENPLEYEYDKTREEKFGVTAALYGYWIKK